MKPILSFYASCGIAAFICCGCPVKNSSSIVFAAESAPKQESVERYYFVKGMTCAGCVFGVKNSLKKAGLEKSQILEVDYATPDPGNSIGHAKVKFPSGQYKGRDTDCKIAKQIREDLGYLAFWEKSITDPCGLGKKGD